MTATPTPLRERIESLFDAIREDAIALCSPTPGGRPRDPDPSVQREIDAVLAALSARDAAGAVDPVQWLRDNYHAYPNIASLCDAMRAAIATPPASGEAGADPEKSALHYLDALVMGAINAGNTSLAKNADDAIRPLIRRLAAVAPAGMVLVSDEAALDAYCAAWCASVEGRRGGIASFDDEEDRQHALAGVRAVLALAAPTPPATAGKESRTIRSDIEGRLCRCRTEDQRRYCADRNSCLRAEAHSGQD